MLPRDKAKVDAWVQQAARAHEGRGRDLPEGRRERAGRARAGRGVEDSEAPADGSAGAAPSESFIFSGAPAAGKPAPPGEEDFLPKVATKFGLPPSAMATGKGAALTPFSHFYYKSTSMHGKQVDVELALYALGKNQVFVIEQMSGPVDPRGVMIVRSLRATS